jgi:hypothetical protein
MKLNFKEISVSWFNSMIHSDRLKKLADSRFDICLECPSKKEIFEGKQWSLKCNECGCPLRGKIYTSNTYLDKDGSCPLEKWKEVEDAYLKDTKTFKTII